MRIWSRLTCLTLGFGAAALAAGCQSEGSKSQPKVTNGVDEDGFPYVVRIVMDGGGSCTGSFLSDSLMLTAAHCVDKAQSVSYGQATAPRSAFSIHPSWPQGGATCGLNRDPKFDVALVRFPAGTYTGTTYALLSPRAPEIGEELTIVGYGNNLIEPFDRFCKLPEAKTAHGTCAVQVGVRGQGVSYDYQTAFEFAPTGTDGSSGVCEAACTRAGLTQALAAEGQTFAGFVGESCDGNFRDRSYKETGSGIKRSGKNVVAEVSGGTVRFFGELGGTPSGNDSASGAGDSGGPLFVRIGGKLRIAAVTHGGSLVSHEGDAAKRSIYVDLNSAFNRDWLSERLAEAGLSFAPAPAAE
jgi:hypothetical protein